MTFLMYLKAKLTTALQEVYEKSFTKQLYMTAPQNTKITSRISCKKNQRVDYFPVLMKNSSSFKRKIVSVFLNSFNH